MLTALELSDASSNNIKTETWHQEEGDQDIKEIAIKKESKTSLTLQKSLSEGKEILEIQDTSLSRPGRGGKAPR